MDGAYSGGTGAWSFSKAGDTGGTWQFGTDGKLSLPAGGDIVDSSGVSVLGGTGGSGDRLTAGTTATLVLLDDGTLKLTHPTEWWSGAYSLEIQKAAGNYHTFKSAYGLSLQATPVPNGYGLNTNTNFVDIFHDGISVNVNNNTWTFGTDGVLTLPAGGAFTSSDYNFSFNKGPGNFAVPTIGTDISLYGPGDISDGEVYMGSGYGEFRSIYNKFEGIESGLAYAGVEGFNYAQYGDVNFAGMVSQTPNIDSMYTIGVNTLSQITIGFTQNGQTQQSTDWSVVVGSLTTDYTVNGLFADTSKTVISGSQEIKLTTNRGTVLFGNQPECVPTVASHFHIMRDDPTTVDLFFGDDLNYVKLPYDSTLTNVGVQIGTDATNLWSFGKDGVLTLPGGNTRIGNVFGTDGIIGSTGTGVGVGAFGQGGYAALQWIDDPENIESTSTQVAAIVVNSPIASTTGTVQIATGLSSGPTADYIWEFGADGNLTIPGDIRDANGSVVRVASTGTVPTRGNGQLWFNNTEGRLYIRDNGLWIDASPTIVPPPSTYLGDIEIDGSTLYINSSTLTINNSGTLLVNGTEVTAPTVNTYLQNLFYN
jgi:hypothetical protein